MLNSDRREAQRIYAAKRRAENPEASKAYRQQWQKDNREHLNAQAREKNTSEANRARHLKRKYGLDKDVYDAMFVAQDSCCAICKTTVPGTKNWHTDHDHTTGKVRGILCSNCNPMLGYAKDNIKTLKMAIEYLRTFNNVD